MRPVPHVYGSLGGPRGALDAEESEAQEPIREASKLRTRQVSIISVDAMTDRSPESVISGNRAPSWRPSILFDLATARSRNFASYVPNLQLSSTGAEAGTEASTLL